MKSLVLDIKPASWVACRVAGVVWRGAVLSRLGGLALRELAPPALPGDDWVRVRTVLAGVCGTDLAIIAQKQRPDSILQAFGSMPMLLGHENVAVVDEVGPAVDPSLAGRRVCVEPTLACVQRGIEPVCNCCRQGAFGACENFGDTGTGRYKLPPGTSIGYNSRTGGSYGEYFVAHQSQLVPVPDGLTNDQAVLTDPLACSLHAVLRANLSGASRVLVYGGGVVALGCVGSLRAVGFGGTIDVAARYDFQAQAARRIGATEVILQHARTPRQRFDEVAHRTGGRVHEVRFGNLMLSGGYDIVFDCVGSVQSITECAKWTAGRGQLVLVGTGHGIGVDLTPLWFRELTVIGAYGRQVEQFQGRRIGTYQLVHEMMQSGKLPTEGLLTHRFALKDYRRAFSVAMGKATHQAVKVVFEF